MNIHSCSWCRPAAAAHPPPGRSARPEPDHRGGASRRPRGAGLMRIRSAAVLGAGTMGAQIAAHLANAGVPSLLLDVTLDAARQGLARARALKPDPFFTRTTHT